MAWFGKRDRQAAPAGDKSAAPIEIGWLVDPGQPSLLFDAPQPVEVGRAGGGDAAGNGEAGGSAQFFAVACPYDLHIRLGQDDKGKLGLRDVTPNRGEQTHRILSTQVTLMAKERWRDPARPLLQFGAPWRFVTDDIVHMTQLPAFAHYRTPPWPGLMIGGRFPIHVWPRSLMWAFDWWDRDQDLVLKRGEPWFYLRFETTEPERPLRMIEAERTPELVEYCQGLDAVTNYVNQTFQLFKTAQERRPARLLQEKARG